MNVMLIPHFRCIPVLSRLRYIKPNAAELMAMAEEIKSQKEGTLRQVPPDVSIQKLSDSRLPHSLAGLLPAAAAVLSLGVEHIVLTLGGEGAALLSIHHLDGYQIPEGQRVPTRAPHVIHVSYMRAVTARVVSLVGAGEVGRGSDGVG